MGCRARRAVKATFAASSAGSLQAAAPRRRAGATWYNGREARTAAGGVPASANCIGSATELGRRSASPLERLGAAAARSPQCASAKGPPPLRTTPSQLVLHLQSPINPQFVVHAKPSSPNPAKPLTHLPGPSQEPPIRPSLRTTRSQTTTPATPLKLSTGYSRSLITPIIPPARSSPIITFTALSQNSLFTRPSLATNTPPKAEHGCKPGLASVIRWHFRLSRWALGWMRMIGAESVEYHRSTVLGRDDDHPAMALEYYASRGETPLVWGGSGRAGLGLEGAVSPGDYEAIFGIGGAREPRTGEGLVRRAGRAWRSSSRPIRAWPSSVSSAGPRTCTG